MTARMLTQLSHRLPKRLDLTPRRIALVIGSLTVAAVLAYFLWFYIAARAADEGVDRQKADYLSLYLETAEADALEALNRLTVSDETFEAAHTGDLMIFAEYCADTQLTGNLPTFGLLHGDGSVISYCDYNQIGFENAQSHFVKLANLTNLDDFQSVLDDWRYYGQHLAEFHYRSDYVWSGEQLFLVVSALVTPSETRLLTRETEAPIIFYGTLNVGDTLLEAAEQRLGIDRPAIAPTSAPREASNSIVLDTNTADQSALVSWTPSNSYRSQFFSIVPFVLLLIVGLVSITAFGLIRINRLQQQLREKEASVRHAAQHDSMTGLANRAYFSVLLDKLLKGGDVTRSIYVGLLELDYFKAVNDTYGHDVGDELIICAAHRLRDALGKGNTAARLGGDEFAFIITSAKTNDEAKALLDAVYEKLTMDFSTSSGTITPSASTGLTKRTTKLSNRADLLKAADVALYEAKKKGRNQYSVSWCRSRRAATSKKLESTDA